MTDRPPPFEPARHFNDQRAEVYDSLIRQVIPGYDNLHAMARLLLRAEAGEAARLLAVGAGTGIEVLACGADNPAWTFTAVEPAPAMLDQARARFAAAGLAPRVALVGGTVDDVPEEPLFDAATLVLVMHFLDDDDAPGGKLDLLKAIARRLRPGAPLVVADMHGRRDDPHFARLTRVWRDWQIAAGIPADHVDKGFKHVARDIRLVPETRILELLAEAGFAGAEPFWAAFMFGGWIAWKA